MKKIIILTILTILCLFFSCYYSFIMAGDHLNSKADVQMQKISEGLKEYYIANNKFPDDAKQFLTGNNFETEMNYGPLSTEIKIYIHEDNNVDLEYLLVPFGPLAGHSIHCN